MMQGVLEKKEIGIEHSLCIGSEQNVVNQKSDFSRAYDFREGYQNQNLIQSFVFERCIEVPETHEDLASDCKVSELKDVNWDGKGKGYVSSNLPLEARQDRLVKIEREIEERWLKIDKVFVPYSKKSEEEIIEEYNELHQIRQQLWFESGDESFFTPNPDYTRAVIKEGNDTKTLRLHAFEYNCLDNSYNASPILLYGHHFIALREPMQQSLNDFFTILINYEVPLLVRLTPDEDYFQRHKMHYCKDCITTELYGRMIHPKVTGEKGIEIGQPIHYVHTDKWEDDKAIEANELYELVQEVRAKYEIIKSKGPIATHCIAGVGRTGTFYSALMISMLLDTLDPSQISIMEIVLRLSIQRPFMVGVVAQYVLLYRFFDYYLEQKSNRMKKIEIK